MTFDKQPPDKINALSGGSNQRHVRAYNERLVLSLVRRHGCLPKSEIARRTGLSAQTASVIMRALESDGLLLRGEPQRGKVGQPSIPMALDPDGVYSFGLKIGRRSADLILMDFLGNPLQTLHTRYAYPMPEHLLEFAQQGIRDQTSKLNKNQRNRISGIGVAMPFELWNWAEKIGAPSQDMQAWCGLDFQHCLQERSEFPVFVQNDATAACGAELIFGNGRKFTDFIYLFIGTFIGGGIVLNHAVYSGRTGNAGALGPMPVMSADGSIEPLIDHASLIALENQLKKSNDEFSGADLELDQWDSLGEPLELWIQETAKHLAIAVVSACSLIDFEAAIIDGDFPSDIKQRIVEATVVETQNLDLRGLKPPFICAGKLGREARAVGAASQPLFSRFLLDQNVLFKDLS